MTSPQPSLIRPELAAIVLCGGKSSRMGNDKADLRLGHQTMLQHICDTMQKVAGRIIIVAAADQRVEVSDTRAEIVTDEYPDEGPLGGFLTGLRYLTALHDDLQSAVWLSACDTPLIPETVIAKAHDALNTEDSDVVAVVHEGRLNPLIAAYRTTVLSTVQNAFDNGERSMTRLLHHLTVRQLPATDILEDLRLLLNVNHPGDLSLAEEVFNTLPPKHSPR